MFEALYRPRAAELTEGERGVRFSRKPLVTELAVHLSRRDGEWASRLRQEGYRMTHVSPERFVSVWVRPLPLWLAHKYVRGFMDDAYRLVWWGEFHGLWHFDTPPGAWWRWRDLRPGRLQR